MAERVIGVGVLGAGNIGGSVARAIVENADAIEQSSGLRLRLVGAVNRSGTTKAGELGIDARLISTDAAALVDHPDVQVIVETMGGEQPAATLMARALANGKHVVTANKEAVAKQMPALLAAARDGEAGFLCEASVGGGIPLIVSLRQIMATNRVERLRGIVNGTTNFILSKMDAEGAGYAETLKEAQELGYAEPDPTADVEGFDASYKLAILASMMLGRWVSPDEI
ncbi:MAG TPA: homoserine dehydrogenase, partial [Thermomicrobiales bacterium]|nr:homoserine dehydrogenase [Thermomicrobiales bacterium]